MLRSVKKKKKKFFKDLFFVHRIISSLDSFYGLLILFDPCIPRGSQAVRIRRNRLFIELDLDT